MEDIQWITRANSPARRQSAASVGTESGCRLQIAVIVIACHSLFHVNAGAERYSTMF